MKHRLLFYLIFFNMLSVASWAQEEVEVHGTYTYAVGENDDITLREAKRKCVELAKAEAIKAAFGVLITSDAIDSNSETNGEAASSYFWENTVAMAKGEWLGDTQAPLITISYANDRLLFQAEVWGRAREITQAQTELQWSVLAGNGSAKRETLEFQSGERVYIKFRSPAADGYLAIYLITGDDQTSCLLPYKKNSAGQHFIKGNREYLFFDKEKDPGATIYGLSTQHQIEENQLVIIYSKNPFTKCNDVTGDKRHPNSLSTHDFQKWLLKCQRADREMVVDKKWITIRKP